MKKISSPDNTVVKLVKKLARKKYSDKEGLYLIEGPNLIDEARRCGAKVEFIVVSEETPDSDGGVRHLNEGISEETEIYIVPAAIFREMSETETPQGILAVVNQEKHDSHKTHGDRIVVLDRVQDPGNVGNILRTARATGFSTVIVKGSADIYSPKVVRSAAGAVFEGRFSFRDSIEETVKSLDGYSILTADMDGDTAYYDADFSGKVAIVVGNEGNGVDEVFKAKATTVVTIPMENDTESLNAAIAASIMMFEAVRP